MPKKIEQPTYVGIFQLMDERCLNALFRQAAKYPPLVLNGLLARLDKGIPLHELAPRMWLPEGNYLGGGYGADACLLPNGHIMVRFSFGLQGEAHEQLLEVAFGPRGGLHYYKERGFSMN